MEINMLGKPAIVVVGGINLDLFIEAYRFPRAGETFEGDRFYTGGGGKGANQAIAASNLTAPGNVMMVGRVGGDIFGKQLINNFDKYGVLRDRVRVEADQSSGIALIFMDETKENYVLPVYGANAGCDGQQVVDANDQLEHAAVLLVQQEIPLDVTFAAMNAARVSGVTVVLDPAPVRKLPEGFVEAADIVVPNQIEAEAVTGVPVHDVESASEAASALRARGLQAAIIKLGENGCYVDSTEVVGHFPGFNVEPVSTVAAGDAFAGGLAVGISEGMGMRDAVELGNAAGALCVTKLGAQDSMPTRTEVQNLLTSACYRAPL